MNGNRRAFLKAAATAASIGIPARAGATPPNVIVILADDLGYGDLGCYGASIDTPNIDQMAAEGVRFTGFDSASPVCTPSRAAFLTGRYPTRYGVPRVLNETDTCGIPDSETTMAQMLKGAGYATMCVGKWHLGSVPQYLPTGKGFDEFFGIPYSIDQGTRPLMHNLDIVEEPATLETLTQRYTAAAVDFITRPRGNPFFLYLGHSYPHLPLAVSSRFAGRSNEGLYGDVVQEIDWSVGEVLRAVRDNGLDSNTLVVFSSDHGPWFQGSPGRLRGRKGETFEGGVRVPFIARFPGLIPGGQVSRAFATSLDLMPTVGNLAGAALPPLPMDGVDIRGLLTGDQTSVQRDTFLYFNDVYLQAARNANWKLHVSRWNAPPFAPPPAEGRVNLPLPSPELYDVSRDIDESHDRSSRNPSVVADLQNRIARAMQTFPAEIQDAYARTKGIPVQGTPAGCFPVSMKP
jgi:arylsulfatase A-like enzyme